MSILNCEEVRELQEAYALGALELGEARAVEAHLSQCADCRMEVGRSQRVAAALPLAVPIVSPPVDLKDRILKQASQQPWWRRLQLPRLDQARLSLATATFATLVAFVAVGWAFSLQARLNEQIQYSQQATQWLLGGQEQLWTTFYGMKVHELQGTEGTPGYWGKLYVDTDHNRAVLLTYHLPALPEGRVYQLWLIRDSQRDSGGTFVVDEEGDGRLELQAPKDMSLYQAVGVTIEPAGGSPGPTGPRLLGGSL